MNVASTPRTATRSKKIPQAIIPPMTGKLLILFEFLAYVATPTMIHAINTYPIFIPASNRLLDEAGQTILEANSEP